MNIIGLGSAGCGIAEAFSQYPQYKIFKIDVDISGDRCYNVPKFKQAEEYEQYKFPKLKSFFKGISGETLFIIGGGGKISCASLRILETIKKLPISILYIKPEEGLLNPSQCLQNRAVFGVMQEYSRSAVFEKMYIVSNDSLDSIADGAPVIGYYDKLNEILVSALHMINVFYNTEPVFGKISKLKDTHRLITIGMFDIEKNKEKMFFSLDRPRHKCYIYSINENKLRSDNKLFKKIKNLVKSKTQENLNIEYVIYSNDWDYDMGYVVEASPYIQLEELNKPSGTKDLSSRL